jgi:hypothetical protein
MRAAGLSIAGVSGYPIIKRCSPRDGLLRLIVDFARRQELIDRAVLEAWSAEQHALSDVTMRDFFLARKPT